MAGNNGAAWGSLTSVLQEIKTYATEAGNEALPAAKKHLAAVEKILEGLGDLGVPGNYGGGRKDGMLSALDAALLEITSDDLYEEFEEEGGDSMDDYPWHNGLDSVFLQVYHNHVSAALRHIENLTFESTPDIVGSLREAKKTLEELVGGLEEVSRLTPSVLSGIEAVQKVNPAK